MNTTSYTLTARGTVFRVTPAEQANTYRIKGTGRASWIAVVHEDGRVTTFNEETMDSMKVKGAYVYFVFEGGRLFSVPRAEYMAAAR